MKDIAQRIRFWQDFSRLDGSTRFALLAIYDKVGVPQPPLRYEFAQQRVDWAVRAWEAAMGEARHVDDDSVPSLSVITGTEIFAEAMGCPVHYPNDNNPFALPLVHSAAQASRLRAPRWQDTRLATLFDMADRMRSLAGPDALLRLPDIQSPLDIAALVWDKNSFYPALMEEPEAVHALIEQCKALLFSFLDDWFARYGAVYMSHYPDYVMQGGVTLSEDEIGVISPAMFREYALPTLTQMSERYGGLGMHCCADSERQWPNLLTVPGLRMLNLCRPIKSARESWGFFAPHVALYSFPGGEGPAPTWPAQYPRGAHAVLQFDVAGREDAQRTLDAIRAAIASLD